MSTDSEKRLAAHTAALFVEPGMRVGLGTGSTVTYLLNALAARAVRNVRYVATSPATEKIAQALGLEVDPFDTLDSLELAIDGADQVAPDGWLVKGRGGAFTREKIVAAAAARFVVIVDSSKVVEQLSPPVPIEVLPFGMRASLRRFHPYAIRHGVRSPDGGVIADMQAPFDDAAALAQLLDQTAGVIGHGLFPPTMVTDVIIATGSQTEHRFR
jgi:ribose 5-phosphate isomerase A